METPWIVAFLLALATAMLYYGLLLLEHRQLRLPAWTLPGADAFDPSLVGINPRAFRGARADANGIVANVTLIIRVTPQQEGQPPPFLNHTFTLYHPDDLERALNDMKMYNEHHAVMTLRKILEIANVDLDPFRQLMDNITTAIEENNSTESSSEPPGFIPHLPAASPTAMHVIGIILTVLSIGTFLGLLAYGLHRLSCRELADQGEEMIRMRVPDESDDSSQEMRTATSDPPPPYETMGIFSRLPSPTSTEPRSAQPGPEEHLQGVRKRTNPATSITQPTVLAPHTAPVMMEARHLTTPVTPQLEPAQNHPLDPLELQERLRPQYDVPRTLTLSRTSALKPAVYPKPLAKTLPRVATRAPTPHPLTTMPTTMPPPMTEMTPTMPSSRSLYTEMSHLPSQQPSSIIGPRRSQETERDVEVTYASVRNERVLVLPTRPAGGGQTVFRPIQDQMQETEV